MDPEFRNHFENGLNDPAPFGGDPGSPHNARWQRVRNAVEDASQDILVSSGLPAGGIDIRPDAKYFMALNYMHMVLEPLALATGRQGAISNADLLEDFRTILRHAIGGLEGRAREVSGHRALVAVASAYPELRASRKRIWTTRRG